MRNKYLSSLILSFFIYSSSATSGFQQTFEYGTQQTMKWCEDHPKIAFCLGALAFMGLSLKTYYDLRPEKLSTTDVETYISTSPEARKGMRQTPKNGYFYPVLQRGFNLRGGNCSLQKLKKAQQAGEDSTLDQKYLIQEYKIHLMPKNSQEFKEVFSILATNFNHNQEFHSVIRGFKCLESINFYKSKLRLKLELMRYGANWRTVPIFVIYPQPGHENAQKALNLVHDMFKKTSIKGANITPSYNKKVTDLIYYAQGNADDKVRKDLQKYFQKPGMIFYDIKQFPAESGYENHELIDPASLD